jgi:aminoglycoside phosphotransferase (APT) family kinase protein
VRLIRVVDSGWDSRVFDLGGRWILRVARQDVVANAYAGEARLLRRLTPTLPIPVPKPIRTGKRWMLVRRIGGTPIGEEAGAGLGHALGEFLRALHSLPLDEALALGLIDVEPFRREVLPLLRAEERAAGERLLAEHATAEFEPALTHADLGPEHILVDADRIVGVLDWTDACVGDPAIDLAWPLYGAPREFAAAVRARYGVSDDLARRALLFHALGPWHEVVHGLHTDPRWLESGLAGVRARLPGVTGDPATMDR